MKTHLLEFARRLMAHAAAPCFEEGTRAEAEAICREHGLECARDKFGNVLVTYLKGGKQRPLALAAHLDHPGFRIEEQLASKRWQATFRGGVPDAYFKQGIRIRFMPQGMAGKLGKGLAAAKTYELVSDEPLRGRPDFAVWELTDFARDKKHIRGRACDDLIGCAAILATLVELKGRKVKTNVMGVLARAEEVGFHGAIMVAKYKLIPEDALVVSLETSKEMPPVKMGQGVIIRVGDRSSIFDSDSTRFLTEVAGDLGKADKGFRFQRALMSGGSCEGTAYQEYGYETAALCVALGNYHNCGAKNRIAAEYVSKPDAETMVTLLVEAARRMKEIRTLQNRLRTRLKKLEKEAQAGFRQAKLK